MNFRMDAFYLFWKQFTDYEKLIECWLKFCYFLKRNRTPATCEVDFEKISKLNDKMFRFPKISASGIDDQHYYEVNMEHIMSGCSAIFSN